MYLVTTNDYNNFYIKDLLTGTVVMDRLQKREEEIKVTMPVMVDILVTVVFILSGMASMRPDRDSIDATINDIYATSKSSSVKWQLC